MTRVSPMIAVVAAILLGGLSLTAAYAVTCKGSICVPEATSCGGPPPANGQPWPETPQDCLSASPCVKCNGNTTTRYCVQFPTTSTCAGGVEIPCGKSLQTEWKWDSRYGGSCVCLDYNNYRGDCKVYTCNG